MKIRIYHNDDSVDIEISQSEYQKLKEFINKQENMQVFVIM